MQPPRTINVMQGGGFVPGLPSNNHRATTQQTSQGIVPPPTFMQQRGQNNFGFGGLLGQHQAVQQSQPNGTSNSIPPHVSQTPNLGNSAPSVSSTSELGLDPNDFPALGSTSVNNNNGNGNNNGSVASSVTTSYASQAGTGMGGSTPAISGTGAATSNQTRDFTPDDFPALGGQSQSQNNQESSLSHPPGLNGYDSQHRQNLLGTLQGTPGMLNLGQQGRNPHTTFDADKQQQQRKLYQSAHAAWNSPNTSNAQVQPPTGLGAFSSTQPQNGTHPSQQNLASTHLNAPPNVPLPLHPGNNLNGTAAVTTPAPYGSNGIGGGLDIPQLNATTANPNPPNPNPNPNPTPNPHPNSTQNSLPNSTAQVHQHPQTPAQQILMSAADRWGLLGLLAMIKNVGTDSDQALSTDLGTMGLDMGYAGSLYSTFITPWADQSAAHTVEPDFHLPACYSVQSPPPGPGKVTAFSDETLFFMFYSSPRDALQEIAAQELFNRNWRFHKELRLWLTKDNGSNPSSKVPGGESGQYTYWDPENWTKERKDMTVIYVDLEEKGNPAFMPGAALVPAPQPTPGLVGQNLQPGHQNQASQRGSFQVGVAV
ncbi:NOT2 family protein [Lentinula aciculospora]|uniref:NOT2 family protein n=1 Tax=Lentinula aciculospora TaxID=153920 RepID=A0A9W9AIP1_9AGAR|nr:NOT2 family protein [Lentinula aciculospora]